MLRECRRWGLGCGSEGSQDSRKPWDGAIVGHGVSDQLGLRTCYDQQEVTPLKEVCSPEAAGSICSGSAEARL